MTYGLWLALGGILIVAEAFAPGFVLIWFGLAALITGISLFVVPDLSWQIQAIMFALLSLGALIAWFTFRPKLEASSDEPTLNQRGAANVGKIVTLETAITNGRGSARLGDGIWSVTGPDTDRGVTMKIVDIQGSTLIVEPVQDTGQSASQSL